MRPFILTALALGALTTTAALAAGPADPSGLQAGTIELTDAQLDLVTAGNNANPAPGYGTALTTSEAHGYWNSNGSAGAPLYAQQKNSCDCTGTSNASFNNGNQSVGGGTDTAPGQQ